MTANLVGFVLGVDGVKHLLTELTTSYAGWTFLIFACGCIYVAVQIMFEYREEERRRGIDRKC
jgi:D-alanyl-lipoteichoic acid acyltransferase DltB (MBOAT superfamily)